MSRGYASSLYRYKRVCTFIKNHLYASALANRAPYETVETGRGTETPWTVHDAGVYRPRTNLCRCHANVRLTAYILLCLDWRAPTERTSVEALRNESSFWPTANRSFWIFRGEKPCESGGILFVEN